MSLLTIFEGYLYREKPLQSSMGAEGRNKGDTFDLKYSKEPQQKAVFGLTLAHCPWAIMKISFPSSWDYRDNQGSKTGL